MDKFKFLNWNEEILTSCFSFILFKGKQLSYIKICVTLEINCFINFRIITLLNSLKFLLPIESQEALIIIIFGLTTRYR